MSNREEEFYRQKYLKYKTKYLEAKNEIEGGQPGQGINPSCIKCDRYIYFLKQPTDKNFTQIFDDDTNKKSLNVINKGCDFDNEVFKLFGNFAYIEVRSRNLGKSAIKSISNFFSKKTETENENDIEFKKLNNATLIKFINGKYDNTGNSYRTSPKNKVSIINDANDDVKLELLNKINTELTTEGTPGFTHYFIKEYSCALKGNTRVSKLKNYKPTENTNPQSDAGQQPSNANTGK